jgi:hypothetical protein
MGGNFILNLQVRAPGLRFVKQFVHREDTHIHGQSTLSLMSEEHGGGRGHIPYYLLCAGGQIC